MSKLHAMPHEKGHLIRYDLSCDKFDCAYAYTEWVFRINMKALIRNEGWSMNSLKEIKKTINELKLFLKEKFSVKSISVFGSYLRGEQSDQSDIDILIEFHSTIDLFEFIKLENFLCEVLGGKVDLVMKDTLKPRIRERILKKAVDI